MLHDIIIRFPSQKIADEFVQQMSTGFGEGLCNFIPFQQRPGTTGTHVDDFEEVYTPDGLRVYFVDSIL